MKSDSIVTRDSFSTAKSRRSFEFFESLVNDRAVAGAIGELPHTGDEASPTSYCMRKIGTGAGPLLIDRTFGSIKKSATRFCTTQDQTFFIGLGVVTNKG